MSDPSTVLETLRACIKDRFGVDPGSVTRETAAADVPGWDSLAHAELLMMVEEHLGRPIPFHRLMKAQDVGELADLISELKA